MQTCFTCFMDALCKGLELFVLFLWFFYMGYCCASLCYFTLLKILLGYHSFTVGLSIWQEIMTLSLQTPFSTCRPAGYGCITVKAVSEPCDLRLQLLHGKPLLVAPLLFSSAQLRKSSQFAVKLSVPRRWSGSRRPSCLPVLCAPRIFLRNCDSSNQHPAA